MCHSKRRTGTLPSPVWTEMVQNYKNIPRRVPGSVPINSSVILINKCSADSVDRMKETLLGVMQLTKHREAQVQERPLGRFGVLS